MRYTVGKHPSGRGYTVFEGERAVGQQFALKREASSHCSKMNLEDEYRRGTHFISHADIVKLRDVAYGTRVQLAEPTNEGPAGKPYRTLGRFVITRGEPQTDGGELKYVPCENSDGKTVLINEDHACRILR